VAGELLLLMVFLDKFWFGPVGKVLDERDATLRSQLGTVKDGSSELTRLTAGAGMEVCVNWGNGYVCVPGVGKWTVCHVWVRVRSRLGTVKDGSSELTRPTAGAGVQV
jgi:hypothetical protein